MLLTFMFGDCTCVAVNKLCLWQGCQRLLKELLEKSSQCLIPFDVCNREKMECLLVECHGQAFKIVRHKNGPMRKNPINEEMKRGLRADRTR